MAREIRRQTLLDRVQQAISTVVGGASREDVLRSTGIKPSVWRRAVAELLQQGRVTRTGRTGGARYHPA
jgi:hypothetical protein